MLDEVLTYARGGGASFIKGLGNAASNNPLPTLLIGVGAAMFLSGKGRMDSVPTGFADLFRRSHEDERGSAQPYDSAKRPGHARSSMVDEAGRAVGHAAKSAVSGVRDAASSAVEGVRDAASSAVSGVSEAVSAVGSTISDATTRAGEGAADVVSGVRHKAVAAGESVGAFAGSSLGAAGEEAIHLRDEARRVSLDMRDRAAKFAEEQPLIVAAAGLALGALIAAALPRTRAEDDLMGETSDTVKHAASEVASEQIDEVATGAGTVVEEIKGAISGQGITAKAAADAVRDMGERVKTAVAGS
jgi:hypothetical protein